MRCLLGTKKLKRYSDRFEKKFIRGTVRGGTDHRVDLYNQKHFATPGEGMEKHIHFHSNAVSV